MATTKISSSELKRFLDAKKYPTRIIGDLERHLQQRPKGDRRTDVLHPSEIIKPSWCKRGSFFLLKGYPKVAANPTLRLQVIFDEGHYIHAKWQRWFQEMGIIHGKFKCDVCDSITFGTSPQECEVCQAPWQKLIYDEVTMIDNDLHIAGHTDGWVKNLGKDTLIEIKSIGPGTLRAMAPQLMSEANGDFMKAWGQVRRPFGEHILQGQMYLELMYRMGMKDAEGEPINEIVFLYELKADNSFKEFPVKRDYELVRHIFEAAEALAKRLEEDNAPKCNINASGSCDQCKAYKEL
jgi:hypothetical protein